MIQYFIKKIKYISQFFVTFFAIFMFFAAFDTIFDEKKAILPKAKHNLRKKGG